MMECVAILRPSDVPVAVSGTFLVMVLLAMVLRRDPDITMGTMITHSRGSVVAKLCKEEIVEGVIKCILCDWS